MTELQLYKYIHNELNVCEDELNWQNNALILQISPCNLDDFMSFIEESSNDDPTNMTYYHGKVQIDLVPICEAFSIDPENILSNEELKKCVK